MAGRFARPHVSGREVRRQLHAQLLLSDVAELDALVSSLVARRHADHRLDVRVDLERRPCHRHRYELAFGRQICRSPAWSPDGKWLVYTADDDAKTIQLEALNVETGKTHALTADTFIYTDPVFSPDGTRLAYVSTRPNGYFNIFVRAIKDGQWAGEELMVTKDNRFPRNRLYFGFWDMHIEPAWTKDGKHLLIVSNRGVALGSGHVWKIPVEPDAMQKATPVLAEQSLFRVRPDISIDGKRFIYSSHRGTGDQYDNLYVLPVDGGEPTR